MSEFECPNCGESMRKVDVVNYTANIGEEALEFEDGTSRVDLVCDDCGYRESGEARELEYVEEAEDDEESEER